MIERRRKLRLKLCCEIGLCSWNGMVQVQTKTEDLSSEGFYCNSMEPFSPGQLLRCDLSIPANGGAAVRNGFILKRIVKVVRVVVSGLEPGFGLACQFERKTGPGPMIIRVNADRAKSSERAQHASQGLTLVHSLMNDHICPRAFQGVSGDFRGSPRCSVFGSAELGRECLANPCVPRSSLRHRVS